MSETLGIDASSSVIGWAIMAGPDDLLNAGIIQGKGKDPFERIDRMMDDLRVVIGDAKARGVTVAVLEVTSGKAAGRFKRRGRSISGLQTLGAGIEAARQTLRAAGLRVELVKENEWTRGVPKAKRAAYVRLCFPHLASAWERDKGMDMADAIGLLRYWFTAERLRSCKEAGR